MYNTTYAELNGDSAPMTKAANLAAGKGILVLNSAGNDGAMPWHYISVPADGDSVIAVGAVDGQGIIGSFSGRGPNSSGVLKPNVCSQGVSSAVVMTDGITGTGSGTSFSCPIMAGAFACLREAFPSALCRSIINAVQQSGNYASDPNDDYGYGIPDFGMAYQILKGEYPSDTLAAPHSLAYPNPFTTAITVSVSGLINGPVSVDMYDLTGRKVFTASYPTGSYADDLLQITPAGIDPGSYILRINNTYTLRITKRP
jgi:serine protease AprX